MNIARALQKVVPPLPRRHACVILKKATEHDKKGGCGMDYQSGRQQGSDYILQGVKHFDLEAILTCGQAFRWDKTGPCSYRGVAFGLCREITQQEDSVIFRGVSADEFEAVWFNYFDFGRNYGDIKRVFAGHKHLNEAVQHAPGIRVLRQDCWEALGSFIFSANNNIPRIKGMVARLCEALGEKTPGGYAFPAPQRLAGLAPDDLAAVRCGFRAGYIIDAARAVTDGRVELNALRTLPLAQAMAMLQKVKGVGPKVANCTLLFGAGRVDCLPVDVWIARALEAWFPQGLPQELRPFAGIAQQYLFHYARVSPALRREQLSPV